MHKYRAWYNILLWQRLRICVVTNDLIHVCICSDCINCCKYIKHWIRQNYHRFPYINTLNTSFISTKLKHYQRHQKGLTDHFKWCLWFVTQKIPFFFSFFLLFCLIWACTRENFPNGILPTVKLFACTCMKFARISNIMLFWKQNTVACMLHFYSTRYYFTI